MTIAEIVQLVSIVIALATLAITFKNKSDAQLTRIDRLEHIATENRNYYEKLEKRVEKLEERDDIIIRLAANMESITKSVDVLNKKLDRVLEKR